jgi:hypothetical protein
MPSKTDVKSITNILENHNQKASSLKISKMNIVVHMKINHEDDIPQLINMLTESSPSNVTIVSQRPYKAYMSTESKEKMKKNISFLLPPVLGYCVTLVWIVASDYYKNNLTSVSFINGLITSAFPAIVAFLFKIKDRFDNK